MRTVCQGGLGGRGCYSDLWMGDSRRDGVATSFAKNVLVFVLVLGHPARVVGCVTVSSLNASGIVPVFCPSRHIT